MWQLQAHCECWINHLELVWHWHVYLDQPSSVHLVVLLVLLNQVIDLSDSFAIWRKISRSEHLGTFYKLVMICI